MVGRRVMGASRARERVPWHLPRKPDPASRTGGNRWRSAASLKARGTSCHRMNKYDEMHFEHVKKSGSMNRDAIIRNGLTKSNQKLQNMG